MTQRLNARTTATRIDIQVIAPLRPGAGSSRACRARPRPGARRLEDVAERPEDPFLRALRHLPGRVVQAGPGGHPLDEADRRGALLGLDRREIGDVLLDETPLLEL